MTSVPQVAEFWTKATEFTGYNQTEMAGASVGTRLDDNFYDGQLAAQKIRDYTGSSSYDAYVTRQYDEYVYYGTVTATDYGTQGFRAFTDGFLEDVLRGTSRATAAKAAILSIITNASYHASGTVSDDPCAEFDGNGGAREVAYALRNHINAILAGHKLTGAQTARMNKLYGHALAHMDAWANGTCRYLKCFQMALSARSLISYYTHITPAPSIITKIAAAADKMWSVAWKESAGTYGAGQSMIYVHRFIPNALRTDGVYHPGEDDFTAADLNFLISPLYAWLYYRTGQTRHRERHDALFVGGIPVYGPDNAYHESGTYLGTIANPTGKHINQMLYWAPEGIAWAEAESIHTGGGPYAAKDFMPAFPAFQAVRLVRVLS
jgi:hypothetical protein